LIFVRSVTVFETANADILVCETDLNSFTLDGHCVETVPIHFAMDTGTGHAYAMENFPAAKLRVMKAAKKCVH